MYYMCNMYTICILWPDTDRKTPNIVLYVLYYHVYYMHAMEDLRWPDTDRKRQGSVIKYCR